MIYFIVWWLCVGLLFSTTLLFHPLPGWLRRLLEVPGLLPGVVLVTVLWFAVWPAWAVVLCVEQHRRLESERRIQWWHEGGRVQCGCAECAHLAVNWRLRCDS